MSSAPIVSVPPGIAVEAVSKSFGGIRALNEVSLSVERGRILGIIGPNGAGKSTLFNVMTGVFAPDVGKVRFGDVEVSGLRSDRVAQLGIARTFQTARGFPSLSVIENLTVAPTDNAQGLIASLVGRKLNASALAKAKHILDRVGLSVSAETPYLQLSGGERRLLEIGRQLMRDPEFVLLDEPTAGVAPEFQGDLETLMRSLRDEGTALVCVEHNMKFLKRLVDEIVVLVHGEVIAAGPAAQVLNDEDVIQAYLGRGGVDVAE